MSFLYDLNFENFAAALSKINQTKRTKIIAPAWLRGKRRCIKTVENYSSNPWANPVFYNFFYNFNMPFLTNDFWKIFENFRGLFYDNVIFKDENNLWSNLELKTKVKDLNLTLVRFRNLLVVKCLLKLINLGPEKSR